MDIKSLIISVTSESPLPKSVNELVFLCKKIALLHLRGKVYKGHLSVEFFSLSLEDLALDCIADLFQQDEQGKFIQIKAYFEGFAIENLKDEELLSHLRRLVFAKVNNGLFRLYNEHDPSLGKILRNIKLAIQSLQNFEIIDRFGEQSLVPGLCDRLEHLPKLERTHLESVLRYRTSTRANIPTILAYLSHYLREQKEYCRIISLMDFAYIIRAIYASQFEKRTHGIEQEESQTINDARSIITDACSRIMQEYSQKYVGKDKVSEAMYRNYFNVIEQHLIVTITGSDGQDFSYFEHLQKCLPELSKEEYQKKHKNQIEYLGRITYDKAVTLLRKNL